MRKRRPSGIVGVYPTFRVVDPFKTFSTQTTMDLIVLGCYGVVFSLALVYFAKEMYSLFKLRLKFFKDSWSVRDPARRHRGQGKRVASPAARRWPSLVILKLHLFQTAGDGAASLAYHAPCAVPHVHELQRGQQSLWGYTNCCNSG
jgi:hypothetical protein